VINPVIDTYLQVRVLTNIKWVTSERTKVSTTWEQLGRLGMRRKRDGEGELKVAPQSRSRHVAVYNTRRPKIPIHIFL
jgi:hypothetical protein